MQFGMVAGEASGDLLAGLLLAGLKQRWPDLNVAGIGGPKMAEQGFEAWWPHHKLAVRGYVEVLRHYRELSGIRDALGTRLLHERPAAFIGVDAPDFNLGLEKRLKAGGIKTVHFVCPSIWAWRGGRAKKMAASADHVLCLFPFEPALLHAHGIAATYVGHPLADAIPLEPPRAASRLALGLADSDTVVAVLPGSRRSEIEHIAPPFLQTAALLHRQRPALRFVLPVSPGLRGLIDPLVATHAPGVPISVIDGRSHAALAACDVTLIGSGTATLEAALFKRPMVIGYHMNAISWQIMKRMGYQPWVGLPNILAEEFLVPELLQDRCTPELLGRAVLTWLDDPAAVERLRRRFDDMHHRLRQDTAQRATDAIAQARFRFEQLGLGWDQPEALVAGIDEAGRGPLAGPVMAAAVILDDLRPIKGLADSKVLTERKRERLFDEIRAHALCCSIASASVEEIDQLNILQATLLAMQRAVQGLRLLPHRVVVDGNRLPVLPMPAAAVVGGDAKVAAISAASVLAKVARDRHCAELHAAHPQYGFAGHKGYSTPEHLAALRRHGPCAVHRRSFAPVRDAKAGEGPP